MLPDAWNRVRRVLVVRLDNIGDVVMTGPALRTIRAALPDAEITLLCSPAGSSIAPAMPWVDEVLVRRVLWQDASGAMPFDPERELALVDTLRRGAYDAAIVLTSFSQSPFPPAYACYLAGIPLRVGQSKEFGGGLLTPAVPPLSDDTHQVDRSLHLLTSIGFDPAGHHLELSPPGQMRASADRLLDTAGVAREDPFVVLAPGASCASRRYDALRFGRAARAVAEQTGLVVAVLGSEREVDLAETVVVAAADPRVRSLAGRTSVLELAAMVERARLVLCNLSGPMHIADAFRRPTVVLFAGTELECQWRPRSAPAVLLRRPTDCAPCYAFSCPFDHECLDLLPEEVATAACGLLRETEPERPAAGARRAGSPGPELARGPGRRA